MAPDPLGLKALWAFGKYTCLLLLSTHLCKNLLKPLQWKFLKYWFKLRLGLVGEKLDSVIHQVRVVQQLANTINWWISFPITHPVESLNNWGQEITIQWILKYQWLLSHYYPLNPVDISCSMQRAKKVVSDSPGLVHYFAIGLVILVLNLPDRQVLFFFGNSNCGRIVINPANQTGFWGWLKWLVG